MIDCCDRCHNRTRLHHVPQLCAAYCGHCLGVLKREIDAAREAYLATCPYDEYLGTIEWEHKRQAALARAGHRCRLCNAAGALEVHHRTYDRRGHEDPDDLIVLCNRCHGRHHKED